MTEEIWKPKNPWFLIIAPMFAAFMFALDETIANIALPHIAGSFSVSNQESIWVLTSYLIASCLTIPMIDWLGKLIGRKNLFLTAVILFTSASLWCGVSHSIAEMVIARFFQGLGGGVLLPIAQAIILETFEGKEQSLAISVFGMVTIIAPILGPVLGGYITENYSWHWIYLINIPIGLFIVYLTFKFFEDPPYARRQKNVKTDYWGLIFLFFFAVCFEIVMDKGNDEDWFASDMICRLTVIWVVALIGFIISQIKQKNTLVKFDVLKDFNYTVGTTALALMNGVLLASMAMLPQFMQNMMGYDSFTSGLTMMPRGIGCLAGTFIYSALAGKISDKAIAFAGVCFVCLGSWLLGFINLEISSASVAVPNIMYGFGMAMGMIPLITYSCLRVPNEKMSNASGLQNFIKTIGGAVGTSLVATFISRFSQVHQNMLTHTLTETNGIYMDRLQSYTSQFAASLDLASAKNMAENYIYNQLGVQAHLWAYIDSFRIFAVAGVIILILILCMHNKKTA